MRKILFSILLILFAWNAGAATWYAQVDPTNGATKICYGTTSHATACAANSNKTFANLFTALTAADTIELSGGASGATYGQTLAPTKACTIRPSTSSGHNGMVTIGPAASSAASLLVNAVSNVTVSGPMTIEGYNGYGNGSALITGTVSNVVWDGLIIKNNYAFLTARAIYISATGANSTGNAIKNCTVLNPTWVDTLTAEGISLSAAHGWAIRNNSIGGISSRFNSGVLLNNSNNNRIYENKVYYSWNGVDYPDGIGTGISAAGTSTKNLIYRNTLENNHRGIGIWGSSGGNVISYNLVKFSAVNGIDHLGTNTTLNEIYNNTVIHTPNAAAGHGISQQVGVGKVIIKNNIVYGVSAHSEANTVSVGTFGQAGVVLDMDNNLYYATGGMTTACLSSSNCTSTLATWQSKIVTDGRSAPGIDLNTIFADPLFVDYANGNYHLQAGSPARGAGVSVGLVHLDPPDIGAFPYVQSLPWKH